MNFNVHNILISFIGILVLNETRDINLKINIQKNISTNDRPFSECLRVVNRDNPLILASTGTL